MPNNNRLQLVWAGLARNNRWSSYIHQKDVDTFNRRMEDEGPEFYARLLGQFRTSFLTGLGEGKFGAVRGFGTKRNSVLPRFLYEATRRVFTDDGVLRSIIDVDAVACVNQLTAVFTKISGGHTPQSEVDVIESFVKTEKEMASTTIDYSMRVPHYCTISSSGPHGSQVIRKETSLETIMEIASRSIRRVLAGADPREISPKHGSGVSACGTKVRDRYAAPRYVKKIDDIWPMSEYYYLSPTAFCDGLQEYMNLPELDPCAKVLLVPKDSRGPRLISCEPRETMWIQQGMMGVLYPTIEGHYLTRHRVNFTRQGFNQMAAYYGSLPPKVAGRDTCNDPIEYSLNVDLSYSDTTLNKVAGSITSNVQDLIGPTALDDNDGLLLKTAERRQQTEHYMRARGLHPDPGSPAAGKTASLDLKDASDKLRLDVVQRLFPPNWSDALTACRSGSTMLPDGRIVALSKHAPMGSACCFPVMALVIWSVLTAIAPKHAAKHILVYGDDIIVPTFMADDAITILEAIGFTVNRNKSFTRGPFRESCGEEYVNGCRVTPVRLRHMIADDAESMMSAFAFSNNLLDCEYTTDNSWFIKLLEQWYGPDKVHILLRDRKRSARWLGESQTLELSHHSRYTTLSGVVYTDDYSLIRLPSGRNRKIHGRGASANKPAYHVPMYRIAVPVPRLESFEACDWCHVLRALLNKSATESGLDAVHNRIRIIRRWRYLG